MAPSPIAQSLPGPSRLPECREGGGVHLEIPTYLGSMGQNPEYFSDPENRDRQARPALRRLYAAGRRADTVVDETERRTDCDSEVWRPQVPVTRQSRWQPAVLESDSDEAGLHLWAPEKRDSRLRPPR